jgi:hypothetical protein
MELSKFRDIDIEGDGNIVGDNNTQNNTTNKTTNKTTNNHHHNNDPKKNSDGSEIVAIGIGAVIGFGALIWWFFNNIDQVYYYLNIATLSSPALALLAIIILLFSGSNTGQDLLRFFGSLVLAVGLFGLSILARDHAPQEIIQFSSQVEFREFWEGLNDKDEHLVISNFVAALLIGLSAIIAHLVSLRQAAYAIANPNRVGFWYGLYNSSRFFSLKVSGSIIAVLSGVVWFALNGHLPMPTA